MLHKIKKHLILWNTMITGIILSIVVIGVCYIYMNQLKKSNLEEFMNLEDTLIYKLKNENTIHNSWLAKLEVKYKAILYIEDNGSPYFFKGSWNPPTPRDIMVKRAKKAALTEGIDTSSYTISSGISSSSILTINGNHKESAYAYVCNIPVKNGYMSLVLIQFHLHERIQISKQILLYFMIYILGLLGLFFASCFFVNKVLKPVEESQKRQTEFIASASHDLRSPLAVIQTNSSALLIDGADPKHFVPKIIEECTRMSRLISDLLILASTDAKSWYIRKEEIDPETYLIDLYDTFAGVCAKKDHQLDLDLPEDPLPQIYGDKDRITQVLGILIDNAISYSPVHTGIIIRPYTKKSAFIIEIEDHGIGIPKDQRSLIFNRFYRADESRSDTTHFGLGLSIAKELIELQNGKIYVKDSEMNGTTFVIELPL